MVQSVQRQRYSVPHVARRQYRPQEHQSRRFDRLYRLLQTTDVVITYGSSDFALRQMSNLLTLSTLSTQMAVALSFPMPAVVCLRASA